MSKSDILELYKLYVQTAEENSKKRLQTNHFYISLNSALLSVIVFLGSYFHKVHFPVIIILPIVGIFISVTWYFHIRSYRQLSEAKFEIINNTLERQLPVKLFSMEWEILKSKKYIEMTKIENTLVVLFLILYITLSLSFVFLTNS